MSLSNLTPATDLVILERARQIEKHGFTLEHDGQYQNDELLNYALYILTGDDEYFPRDWDVKWKMSLENDNYIQLRAKAIALLIADLDTHLDQ